MALEFLPFQKTKKVSIQLQGTKHGKKWYIPLFLIRCLIVSLLLQLGITLTFTRIIYPLLILTVFYLFLVICLRPYKTVLDQLGIICCELSVIFATLLPLLLSYIEISELYQNFILLVLQGCILITMFITLIRLIILYKDTIKSCCSSEEVA